MIYVGYLSFVGVPALPVPPPAPLINGLQGPIGMKMRVLPLGTDLRLFEPNMITPVVITSGVDPTVELMLTDTVSKQPVSGARAYLTLVDEKGAARQYADGTYAALIPFTAVSGQPGRYHAHPLESGLPVDDYTTLLLLVQPLSVQQALNRQLVWVSSNA